MEDGQIGAGLVGGLADGVATRDGQRDRARQTGVPDDKAGIGRGDEQTVVHIADTAGDFLGQQGAGDEAEAPVQPAADDGHKGGDENGALLVLGGRGDSAQEPLKDLGGGHGGAQHQNQGHLHREGQQIPETAGVAPRLDHGDRALLCTEHCGDIHNDAQDDGEQERVRQPPVDYAHAAIGKFFEHAFPSLQYSIVNKPQHNLFTIPDLIINQKPFLST